MLNWSAWEPEEYVATEKKVAVDEEVPGGGVMRGR